MTHRPYLARLTRLLGRVLFALTAATAILACTLALSALAQNYYVRRGAAGLRLPTAQTPPTEDDPEDTGPSTLADLTDVSGTLAPTNGQVLAFNGSLWDAATPASVVTSLAGLSDVSDTLAPTSGQLFTYSGGQWGAAAAPTLGFRNFETVTNSLSIPTNSSDLVEASCTGGKILVGGGCNFASWQDTDLSYMRPMNTTTFRCNGFNDRATANTLTVYARCVTP